MFMVKLQVYLVLWTGLELAIDRDNTYIEAGADATYVEAPRSKEELETIAKETSG